jgi:hypothetical protein
MDIILSWEHYINYLTVFNPDYAVTTTSIRSFTKGFLAALEAMKVEVEE